MVILETNFSLSPAVQGEVTRENRDVPQPAVQSLTQT